MKKTTNLLFYQSAAVLFLLSLAACTTPPDIKPKYYITDDHYHEMTIGFAHKKDSVHLWYLDIMDNGNYLNGPDDTIDYAGSFLMNDLKNGEVGLTIKSYRNEDQRYPVHLKFSKDWQSFSWEITGNEPAAYLPKTANFKEYKNDSAAASPTSHRL